jgi:Zn-dependent protease/CBS domain-containing protein
VRPTRFFVLRALAGDFQRGRGSQPLRLFRLFGIDFTASWSWIFLVALLVYVAASTFRSLGLAWSPQMLWSMAVVAAVLAACSLYAHELAHALVAIHFGIPVRSISLFLLGGMAHITRESPSPRAELLIAIAGPASSLSIGIVAAILSWALWQVAPPIAALGVWLALMNIPLAIFNLVPAFPLDGGRVLRAVLWFAGEDQRWGSTVAARVGQVAAAAMLFTGVYLLFERDGAISGIWLILIAWFMYAGAVSAQHAAVVMDVLRRLSVASVMQRKFGRVDAELTLQAFAEEHLLADPEPKTAAAREEAAQSYAVYRDENLVGLLSPSQLGRIPVQAWSQTPVDRAMVPIESAPSLEPGAPALGALHLLLEDGYEAVAVVAEGRLLGLVTRLDLAKAAERSAAT